GISIHLAKVAETKDQFEILEQADPNILGSYLKTLYGTSVYLRPILSGGQVAQLVFQKSIDISSNSTSYYLSPGGAFELFIPGNHDKQFQLLCGLAGTERINFTAGNGATKGDLLVFYPGNAAYTKAYPVVQRSVGDAAVFRGTVSQSLLTDDYTTSWAFVQQQQGNEDVIYSAAPATASLYRPKTLSVYDAYYADTARLLQNTGNDGPYCFPMVPYAGILQEEDTGFSLPDITSFELQIIGGARKEVIGDLPTLKLTRAADIGTVTTTTPQGLIATITGTEWNEVLLAKNAGTIKDFAFTTLPAPLRNAFQTNELFLVTSDSKNLGPFQNLVYIDGWTFNVDVPERGASPDPVQKNILLLKFRKGAIVDLIQDVNSWTAAEQFNHDKNQVTSTQTWLIQYCA
ncbi:MAG: hypothetical protein ACREGF_05430, partial [Candidatus Saccharimonadales bacterium]